MIDKKTLKEVETLMRSHGFAFNIWACGCCASPQVEIQYKGDLIFSEYDVSLKMFEEDSNLLG